MKEGSRRAVITAFFANLGIALAKFIAFLFTGAASMLAEAVHSVADTANQGLLLLGNARASRAPTPEHPFGFARERYFWAFVVSVVLFTLGALFACYEGVQKLRHPHAISSPEWAFGVLFVAIVFEGFAFRTAARAANPLRRGASWWAFIRRAKSPELPVVLLEDSGALLGLSFALVGVTLALLTGDARFDALGSIAIGLLLGAIAIVLAVEMKSLLIGESAAPRQQRAIAAAIEGRPEVRRLIDLRTQHLGPEQLLVCAKVELDSALTFPRVVEAIDAIQAGVRTSVPAADLIYLEPDVLDPGSEPYSGRLDPPIP
jgi:cation diffusion facilitator family transporter